MNQPVTVAGNITLGQYFAMIEGWNIANTNDDEDHIEPPTAEWWEAQQQRMKNNPHLTMQ